MPYLLLAHRDWEFVKQFEHRLYWKSFRDNIFNIPLKQATAISRTAFPAKCLDIQGVPLATEPGISLIILTPMKILQRNLNRITFVVWEIKRNVSVVCVCSALKLRNGAAVRQVANLSFRRDFDHRARPIWRRLIISYGDIWKREFTKTNHEP